MFIYPESHTASKCMCPLCEDRCMQARVTSLMRSMSPSVCERMLTLLIRPFLESLSDLLPTLFPLHWVNSPPYICDTHSVVSSSSCSGHHSLRHVYLEMCMSYAKVRNHPSVNAIQLVHDITLGGENIYSRLLTRRRFLQGRRGSLASCGFRVCITRIRAQIESIKGLDVVFCTLRSQIEELNGFRATSYTPFALCKFACSLGMVERMLSMVLRFREQCALTTRGRKYLDELAALLGALIQSERCMRLAVAMALHARLGAESGLAVLGNDVLVLCVPTVVCEPIGTWSMLLNL